MTRTDWLCRALRASGALALRGRLARVARRRHLTILAYHRVLPARPADFAFDPDVVSCTAAEFAREMEFVAAHFDPLTFRDLASGAAESRRRPLLVTFDDGYRDNHDVAWPILRRVGVPATFFVTTGFIDGDALPWWDEIRRLIRGSSRPRLDLGAGGEVDVDTAARREEAIRRLLREVKQVPNAQRLATLERLRAQCGRLPEGAWAGLMMGWPEVRALAGGGMEIGSHTVTHPVLGNLESPAELARELAGSRQRLEAQTGVRAEALAYPVGRARTVTGAVVAAARAAGYRYACVYEHGLNPRRGFDPFRLRRIKAEVGEDFARFRAKVLFPRWVRY